MGTPETARRYTPQRRALRIAFAGPGPISLDRLIWNLLARQAPDPIPEGGPATV